MKYIKYSFYLLICLQLVTAVSCKHEHALGDSSHDHGDEKVATDGNHHGNHHKEGEIHLSNTQIEAIGLEFGTFSDIKINDYIKATGTLSIPPNGLSMVAPKAMGTIVGSRKFVEGEYIKKGSFIAFVVNPEFIIKQQEYLQVKAEMVFTGAEVERQESLIKASAGVERTLQQIQSQLGSQKAQLSGLEKYLGYLGINPTKLTITNITDRIGIYSGSSGYISTIQLHDGMYVQPSTTLLEIISTEHLHLELDVFEKDINSVALGQKITYYIQAYGNEGYKGEVSVIGKVFTNENKTVRVHGHLDHPEPKFINNLFVNAKIWLNDQKIQALPEGAIIREGDLSHIFAAKYTKGESETVFKKLMVTLGSSDNGFTAVTMIDNLPVGMTIVTKGSYFVQAQSKAGELAHEH